MATQKILSGILLLVLSNFYLPHVVFSQTDSALAEVSTSTSQGEESQVGTGDALFQTEIIEGVLDVGDFVVGPGRAEISVLPGQTVVQELVVTNRISEDRIFRLQVEDIAGSADGSASVILSGEERGPYSIRDYISIPADTFTLRLGERARIPVTIQVPPDAEPGGYYGSILVSTERAGNGGGEGAQSPIVARIGSLFFITVEGDITVSGKTRSISTIGDRRWFESGPIDLAILYENTGSVHVNAYGELSVKNMFGEEVGFVELDPWFILPQSLRSREVVWDREFLFGRYTVTARVNRGYEDIVDEVSTTFWVVPWKIIGIIFVILFIVIFAVRLFFKTFEFKKKTG